MAPKKSEWLLRMQRLYEKYGHIADPWVPDPEAWKYKKVSEDASAATGSGCAGIGPSDDVSSTGAASQPASSGNAGIGPNDAVSSTDAVLSIEGVGNAKQHEEKKPEAEDCIAITNVHWETAETGVRPYRCWVCRESNHHWKDCHHVVQFNVCPWQCRFGFCAKRRGGACLFTHDIEPYHTRR